MMAVEAVKLVAGAGAPLAGEMLIYDALYGETRKFALQRRAGCPVCGGADREGA
jgi:molybdopterin/thiamine biosynthesis adenylyltransferase